MFVIKRFFYLLITSAAIFSLLAWHSLTKTMLKRTFKTMVKRTFYSITFKNSALTLTTGSSEVPELPALPIMLNSTTPSVVESWGMNFNIQSENSFGTTEVQVGGSVPKGCSFLFTGILSGPDMIHRRNAIRQTYLKNLPGQIVYRFILGNPTASLAAENEKFKDMVS